MEEYHLTKKIACNTCGKHFNENNIEDHNKTQHEINENKCETCPTKYTTNDQMKRHNHRAHIPVECMLCCSQLESRISLKHHKKNVHNVTKITACQFALQGKCIDEDECLYSHENITKRDDSDEILDENNASAIKVKKKCNKCTKVYNTDFEIRRHTWRTHEVVECIHCGHSSKSRQELETHKKGKHGVTKTRTCKFWVHGKCLDGSECLFSHETQSNNIHKLKR